MDGSLGLDAAVKGMALVAVTTVVWNVEEAVVNVAAPAAGVSDPVVDPAVVDITKILGPLARYLLPCLVKTIPYRTLITINVLE